MDFLAGLFGSACYSNYFFRVSGFPEGTFSVLGFTGSDHALCGDYRFTARLLAPSRIDPSAVIGKAALLELAPGSCPVHGVIASFASSGELPDGHLHTAVLASPLHPLCLGRSNRVFIGRSAPQILEEIAREIALPVRMALREEYPVREFTVQFDESDFDFLQRLAAMWGIFHRMEQGNEGPTLHFHDTLEDLPRHHLPLVYREESGAIRPEGTVFSLRPRARLLAAEVELRDYNYRTPETPLRAAASPEAGAPGAGRRVRTWENAKDLPEAQRIARLHQEALDGRRETFLAETDCRDLAPGLQISIAGHPELDGDYLILGLEHQGDQRSAFAYGEDVKSPTYRNTLHLIRAGVPWRPTIPAERRFHGTTVARVETAGGDTAHLDEQGRYRVRLGFDAGEAPAAGASHPVRMMQPYGGSDYGLHLPLHAGTEVLLSFVGGHLDRPVILGALPNPDTPTPVAAGNPSQNILRTASGNELLLDDRKGKEKIELFTAGRKNILTLDADGQGHTVRLATAEGKMEVTAAKTMLLSSGETHSLQSGADHLVTVENAQRLTAAEGEIAQQAAADIRMRAGENIQIQSEEEDIVLSCGENLVAEAGEEMSVEVRSGDLEILVESGSLSLKAAEAVSILGEGGGSIRIGQGAGEIEIAPDGSITIEAPEVEIVGNTVAMQGSVNRQGGGGGGASGAVQLEQSAEDGFGLDDVASLVLDFIPGVSTVKSLGEAFTGADLVTGEPISRWVALAGAVPFAGSFAKGFKGAAKASKAFTKVSKVTRTASKTPTGKVVASLERTCTRGCPISMITGEELLDQVDFTLPGPLPLLWKRLYRSSSVEDRGLGFGWSFDGIASVSVRGDQVLYEDGEGRIISFDRPAVGEGCRQAMEGLTLYCDAEDLYRIAFEESRHLHTFAGTGPRKPLVEVSDRFGNAIHYRHENGRLTAIRDSAGRRIDVVHTPEGRISALVLLNAQGAAQMPPLVRYHYSEQGDLIAALDRAGHGERYQYRNHVIVRRTTKTGFNFHFEWDRYDAHGRCLRNWGDRGIYDYRFAYDAETSTTRSTDGRGVEQTFRYNGFGLIDEEILGEGGIVRKEYDDAGRLTAVTDPAGNKTRYEFDTEGRLTRITDPAGQTSAVAYGENGQPASFVDAAGNVWSRRYDDAGNLVETVDPMGGSTRLSYTSRGQLACVTDPLGNSRFFQWNERGELLQVTEPTGAVTSFEYDDLGNVVRRREGERETRFRYDISGNLTEIVHPDGATVRMAYDPAGNLVRYVDPAGRATVYEYGGLSQVERRTDPDGRTFTYQYDAERNLTALVNENGERYQLVYDRDERLVKEIGFDGREQTYQYDPAGRLLRHADAGRVTEFVRDLLGRLLSKTAADGQVSTFSYDPLGRLTEARGSHAAVRFDYDPAGNLLSEEQDGVSIRHAYDGAGNRVRTDLPDGRIVDYAYDTAGFFTRLDLDGQTLTRIERDPFGFERSRTAAAGLVSRFQYDPAGRILSMRTGRGDKPIIERSYGYDGAGHLARIEDLRKGVSAYSYDSTGRLRAVTGDASEIFRFDPTGNLLDEPSSQKGYVQGNRLRVFQDLRFDYDEAGNIVRERRGPRETRFAYDGENRLVRVEKEGQVFEYRYDPLGRRISKKDAFGETRYLWNGDVLLSETRGNNRTDYLFEPESFRPVCQIRNGAVYHYHLDHLGTPQEITDSTGHIVWSARYRAYGKVANYDIQEIENPLRFQGQYYDQETGLHYNRHRYYHPEVGRFIHQDPVGLQGGANLYEYAPNPVSWVDPLGLTCKAIGGGRAESAKQAADLSKHLGYSKKYGQGGVRELESGRVRYYGELQPAKKSGEMAGRRYVHEFDPSTGGSRGWHETLDHGGTVRQVRPEMNNGVKKHYQFDRNGNYTGSW